MTSVIPVSTLSAAAALVTSRSAAGARGHVAEQGPSAASRIPRLPPRGLCARARLFKGKGISVNTHLIVGALARLGQLVLLHLVERTEVGAQHDGNLGGGGKGRGARARFKRQQGGGVTQHSPSSACHGSTGVRQNPFPSQAPALTCCKEHPCRACRVRHYNILRRTIQTLNAPTGQSNPSPLQGTPSRACSG